MMQAMKDMLRLEEDIVNAACNHIKVCRWEGRLERIGEQIDELKAEKAELERKIKEAQE